MSAFAATDIEWLSNFAHTNIIDVKSCSHMEIGFHGNKGSFTLWFFIDILLIIAQTSVAWLL